MKELMQYSYLFMEQTWLMMMKHISQRQRKGRQFWKDSVLIEIVVLAFVIFILYFASELYYTDATYLKHSLPPLSTTGPWGIFGTGSIGTGSTNQLSKNLFYSPNNNDGVNALIADLVAEYPDIKATGVANSAEILDEYSQNLFDTWAAIEFDLNSDQQSTGQLVTSTTSPVTVSYSILISPSVWDYTISTTEFTEGVYNDQMGETDTFWQTGYLTLQNFISTNLAKQYTGVPDDFTVNTFVQRYPRSPIYENNLNLDISLLRNVIWKWIGGTVLAICIFVPMLSLLTEIVKERQFRMKDLLEISGLMNIPYWISYMIVIMINCQFTMWICVLILYISNVVNGPRVLPYVSLMSAFMFAAASFGMAFGFVVPRSEYYGLPVFLLNTALSVGGAYLDIAYNVSAGAKLFICFLNPSIALTMGVLTIESYLYSNDGDMDYNFQNDNKEYPSLNSITGVMIASAAFFLLIVFGMPFDIIFKNKSFSTENYIAGRADEVKYPCDKEDPEEDSAKEKFLLQVNELSHVYPDGTNAVKEMSFNVKEGEVLSFLGANGAGKSTCMGMLCGTLDATFGDASVNGYSISNERTLARRNLGIAMQQDIIWDDVNVQDHLLLFGRLRGLHGKKLRDDVEKMLQSLGFPEKARSLAGTLSGGQKRRLCVGLSMVGGNSVVYLDEPTAGLDPVSRRQLWELVERNREGRAILLTTHFMDEADVLGDRIAVVKEGRLRALGTSKFLKRRFGLGYLLRMSLKEGSNPEKVHKLVSEFIPESTVASSAGTELSLRLPREAVPVFPDVFEQIETESESLGIMSYGIETTTLEEVFMRIVNEDAETLLMNHEEANRMLTASKEERDIHSKKLEERDMTRNPWKEDTLQALLVKGTGDESIMDALIPQTKVMIRKRLFQFVRSRGQWAMGVVVPFVIAIMVGALLRTSPTEILSEQDTPITATVLAPYPVPVAGPSESLTNAYIADAFGNSIDTTYVGENYTALYNYIALVATEGSSGASGASSMGIAYDSSDSLFNFTVLYNQTYPMNFGATVQTLLNAAVANATNNLLTVDQTYASLPANKLNSQLNNGFFVAMLVSLLSGSIGAGLSIVVSGERVSQVKHQQLASGASTFAYWLGNFIFDFSLIYFLVMFFAVVITIFAPDSYSNDGFGNVICGGLFFTIAGLFRFYICSYFISDVKLAQSIYFYGSIAVVFAIINIWFTILFNQAGGNAGSPDVIGISAIFAFFDPSFGWYMIILYQNNFLGVQTQNEGDDFFSFNIAGIFLLMLALSSIFYGSIFIFGTENALGSCLKSMFCCCGSANKNSKTPIQVSNMKHNKVSDEHSSVDSAAAQKHSARGNLPTMRVPGLLDPDVAAEKERVTRIYDSGIIDARENAIFIHNMRKVYFARGSVPSKVAVRDINVSIPAGEIFGLLGANGAGKTTLLKMVSGQELPSSGVALINGFDVVEQTSQAQRSMGLCPQFDTLVERLSVRENLLFFGRIKGLSDKLVGDGQPSQLATVTDAFMLALNIKKYENKLIQQLSGGNRRKISLAVALMGAPPTVYLDEPSTGLDPVASRLMWRLLSKISAAKSSAIVLTTHNMLECEAVCTRICIMKMGQMVCLGDNQHLRSTHGTGFLLEINLLSPNNSEKAKQFVEKNFMAAVIIEEQGSMINYEIPKASINKLSQAFRLLEANKESLGIVDYALSQSTLEQVFLKQIRPNERDLAGLSEQAAIDNRVPQFRDYLTGYCVWLLAGLIPGLHHFYLGNFWRGLKYFFTINEAMVGWILDLFELHVLIQKSVQEKGNLRVACCCNCLLDACCCCCQTNTNQSDRSKESLL